MRHSLRTKLSVSYILVAIICILLLSVFTNYFLDKYFQEYVRQNQEQKSEEIVKSLAQLYQTDGIWDDGYLEGVGVSALQKNLIIRIKDQDGKLLWDANVQDHRQCVMIIEEMAQNMKRYHPSLDGNYEEKPYPILVDDVIIGQVEIGYYTPFHLDETDLEFLYTLNKVQIGVGLFSLLLALLVGGIMARRLSTPISRVTDTAQMISRGYYDDRIEEESSTIEIGQLTEAINNLAQSLESQELLRKRLTADVAHELRTPLATLQSHMEAMIEGIWEADKARLESCHEEIVRIGKMIGGLEKLAKYENEVTLDKQSFDIKELISRILSNFENSFSSEDIEVDIRAEESVILADKDKISQVIVNLLANALKYTPSGGWIKINVNNLEDNVVIRISDNGVGISKEDIPYIFERFYRADGSRNKFTGGLGLGLTISKAIVDAHKGQITVRSESNVGTEFVVLLPKQ